MSFIRENQYGFTKIELLVIILILGIFGSLVIPGLTSTMVSEREAEVKNNLHIIRMAIERYFLDNDKYPPFLLGGDLAGWNNWHEMNDEDDPPLNEPSNNLLHDVLIQYGYLSSYPKNPFVDDGMAVIELTGGNGSGVNGSLLPGDGDPRFGFDGDTMGNGLSDPAFYQHLKHAGIPPTTTPLIETRRTLSDSALAKHGFLEPPDGVHYMMGGRKQFDSRAGVITVASWWPGNFFYRGLVDYQLVRMGWSTGSSPGIHPPGAKRDLYILGAYGSLDTPGLDVIRLESRNWENSYDIYYRLSPPWYKHARNSGKKCGYNIEGGSPSSSGSGLPEVAGGGDANTGPYYPYNRGDPKEGYKTQEYIFGAPDGHPDGVILVYTSENVLSTRIAIWFQNEVWNKVSDVLSEL